MFLRGVEERSDMVDVADPREELAGELVEEEENEADFRKGVL